MSDTPIVIERTFDAPINFIWQMWTKPEEFKRWYGPKGFSMPVARMDLRVGGKHLFCMQSPDGRMKMWTSGEYTEIVPNKRLVYTESPSDEHGNVAGDGSMPATVVTVVLEDVGNGRTKMVMTHAGFPVDQQQGAHAGWVQAFDKIEDLLDVALNDR